MFWVCMHFHSSIPSNRFPDRRVLFPITMGRPPHRFPLKIGFRVR